MPPTGTEGDEVRNRWTTGQVRNRGMILVAVLFFASLLGIFAAVATMSLSAGADASRSFAESLRAEEAMRGALEQIANYATAGGPPPTGATVIALGSTTVVASVQDEIARIDLNEAAPELLAGIFRVVGIEANDAKMYAARIVDWRDADDRVSDGGAETAAYRAAGRTDGPRNGPFQHVAELALVLGIPAPAAAAVAPYVTVASGNEKINPLIADPPVLLALPGVKEDQIVSFLQERQSSVLAVKDVTMRLGNNLEDYITTENGKAFRVEARIRFGGRYDRRFEAVITSLPGDTEPYRILAWDANPPGRVRQTQQP
jgi:general secretion pathway protein K